jgi:starch phosphorylase
MTPSAVREHLGPSNGSDGPLQITTGARPRLAGNGICCDSSRSRVWAATVRERQRDFLNMACQTSKSLTESVSAFEASIRQHIRYSLGKSLENLSQRDLFMALALTVRDWMVERMLETEERYRRTDAKRMYYLSMEFLIGRSLANNLSNLGLLDLCRETLLAMGVDLEEVQEREPDAALGNGGLGRLAACFLDSLATLDMPGYGYGINYEYGLFKQEIDAGYQKEKPDNWLAHGTPWQIERPDQACLIPVYGRIEHTQDRQGRYVPKWVEAQVLIGIPCDMPIVGYSGRTTNFLRLYSARSSHEFDMQIFNQGDYLKAVEMKIATEIISKVLYPSDSVKAGRELRLVQEYFLVACALRDIVRRYLATHKSFEQFPTRVAIQLNDTHPALAVAELMRILVDDHGVPWRSAWTITQATIGYTNHTLLPEAMEKWPVSLFEYVLPRHLQIIYDINQDFLQHVSAMWPGDIERLRRMSLIEEGEEKRIRMAHLAIVGSHSVNGVAALHTELVKASLVPDFYALWPERFNNKTNGVTQRRWLLQANPLLGNLIHRTISDGWITDLEKLNALESYAEDQGFQQELLRIKRANKERLARVIKETTQVNVDPNSLFDIQVKRIHEYKRQLLNVMHIIHEYLCLIEDHHEPTVPRTYIFAGKAAPGYWAAKQIIKLINNVGAIVNNDPRVKGQIKVVFIPDYRVSLAEKIIPAADLSEHISTAGKEASGTSNMKFAMNGALTIGTPDGANIEIMQEVGAENIFIFGLTAKEIRRMRQDLSYHPRDYYQRFPALKRVMDAFNSNVFCPYEPGLFIWIYQSILDYGDEYFHLADLASYLERHEQAGQEFKDPATWARKAILNVARVGKFSSDRTVREYAREIWHIKSL